MKKTRKERKQARKNKPKTAKKLTGSEEISAKELGKLFNRVAKERSKRSPKFTVFYCEKCQSTYCIQAMGQDNYCRSCFKFEYREQIEAQGGTILDCDFKTGGRRVCQKCGGA